MPGFELFGEEEKKQVNEVLETGILMRYGFDGPRNGMWKSKELEAAVCSTFGSQYAQLTSSGTAALTTAMAALGVGVGDEVIMPAFTFVASFEAILNYMKKNNLNEITGSTEIMIMPGYDFKVCDALVTNFHQPSSTLILLVAAFTKGNWRKIYNEALDKDYRFLSYGDSSLLWGN